MDVAHNSPIMWFSGGLGQIAGAASSLYEVFTTTSGPRSRQHASRTKKIQICNQARSSRYASQQTPVIFPTHPSHVKHSLYFPPPMLMLVPYHCCGVTACVQILPAMSSAPALALHKHALTAARHCAMAFP